MAEFNIKIMGHYQDKEKVLLSNGNILNLLELIDEEDIPLIPYGTKVEITIKYDKMDFLNGVNGIVWATYNYNQADTIKNALFVQNIFGTIKEMKLTKRTIYNIHIKNALDVKRAINFIWKEEGGMRLYPDWYYPANTDNESFNKWTNGY